MGNSYVIILQILLQKWTSRNIFLTLYKHFFIVGGEYWNIKVFGESWIIQLKTVVCTQGSEAI